MGVDLEKKRKLLLYPIEYQPGSRCEWVLGFARTAVMRAGSNMGPGEFRQPFGRLKTRSCTSLELVVVAR